MSTAVERLQYTGLVVKMVDKALKTLEKGM